MGGTLRTEPLNAHASSGNTMVVPASAAKPNWLWISSPSGAPAASAP